MNFEIVPDYETCKYVLSSEKIQTFGNTFNNEKMSISYLVQMLEAPRMKSEERAKNKSRVEKEVAMFFVMKEILLYVLFGCVVIWICILEVPEDTHLFYNHIKGIMVDSRSYPFKVIIHQDGNVPSRRHI